MPIGEDFAFPSALDRMGLTKREWMATSLLAGLMADPTTDNIDRAVEFALRCTDKLIAELNKSGGAR